MMAQPNACEHGHTQRRAVVSRSLRLTIRKRGTPVHFSRSPRAFFLWFFMDSGLFADDTN